MFAVIFEVKQVTSAGSNTFDVISNGYLVYRGSATWFPLGVDKNNKVILTDPNGNMIFQTKYSLIDNLAESSVPFKYLINGEQKFSQYQVVDVNGNDVGCFYDVRKSFLDSRLCISFGNRVIYGYTRDIGLREVVSFYENDRQIGQITRTRKVVDNLDWYYVHFLPEYDVLLPLMAMYTIFYDYCFHNSSGQYVKGTYVNASYTYDYNSKKYNKNFIRDNFGEQEHARLEAFINRKVEFKVGNLTMKQFWIIFAIVWIAIILFTLILGGVMWYIIYNM